MALGFIKKVFSFGRKQEPAQPAPEHLTPAEIARPEPAPPQQEPVVEAVAQPIAEPVIEQFTPAVTAPVIEPFAPLIPEPDPTPEPADANMPDAERVEALSADPPMPVLDEAEIEAALEAPEPVVEERIEPEPEPIHVSEPGPPESERVEELSADPPPEIVSEIPAVAIADVIAEVEEPKPRQLLVSDVVAAKPAPAPEPVAAPRKGWFERLREGLSRSSRELAGGISGIFTKRKLDEATLEELEEVLLRADLGVETAMRVTDALSVSRYGRDVSGDEVRAIMAQEVEKVLGPVAKPLELDLSHRPHVILVVGVNGTGKTTTIGKLAAKLTAGGLSVMLAAGDTFRAAAIEQLKIWGERTGSPVVSSRLGADAAGLAYEAYEKAKEAGSDVLLIDTAGRLQNKTELMAELEKVVRVLGKHDPEAPHTVLQTVDATTGQNALSQVEIFRNVAGVSGLVMTKLDGTARGGILVAIAAKHKLPVYFIGVGEQVDDLEPFSASDFARAIAGVG